MTTFLRRGIAGFLLLALLSAAFADEAPSFLDRRKDQFFSEPGYYVFPMPYSIPGVGAGAGVIGMALNVDDSHTDLFGYVLGGGLTGEGVRSRSLASGITGTLSVAGGLDFEETVVEVGGAYEVMKCDPHTAVDILAGARYWHQDMSVNLALAGTLDTGDLSISGNRAIARSGSVDWVDPLIGGRIRYNLAPGQDFILRGDVGGFGVGSQFSWNALAAYSFAFAKRDGVTYSGLLGYRALSADYEQGSGRTKYVYDVVMHGPVTGLTIGF